MNLTLDTLGLATDCARRAASIAGLNGAHGTPVAVEIVRQAARLAATGEVERTQNIDGLLFDGTTRTPEELSLAARRLATTMKKAGDQPPFTLRDPMEISRGDATVAVQATFFDGDGYAHLWRLDLPISGVEVGAVAAAYMPKIAGVKAYTIRRPDMVIAHYRTLLADVAGSYIGAAGNMVDALLLDTPPENPRSRFCRTGSCPSYGRFECLSTRGYSRRGKL